METAGGQSAVPGAAETAHAQALHDRLRRLHERTITLRAYALGDAAEVTPDKLAKRVTWTHVADLESALADIDAELEGLRTAMRTRAVIEQAKGMLMARRRIDAEEAFATLVTLSQSTHRKLVDVAATLVENCKVLEPAEG